MGTLCCEQAGWWRQRQRFEQRLKERISLPIRPRCRHLNGGATFVDIANTLERLGIGRQPEERLESMAQVGSPQRLGAREDGPQGIGTHERSEDQVDKATFVTLTAPVVEALLLVLMERSIAAPNHGMKLAQFGKLLRHPEFAA